MKVFLHDMVDISEVFPPGEVLKATVAQRVDGGYIIKLDGAEFYARSELDLSFGQSLRLRTLELSPAQWILKVISPESSEAAPTRELIPWIDTVDNYEVHAAALKALAELNLPMTQDRLNCLADLVKDLLIPRKSLVPEGDEGPLPIEVKDLVEILTKVLEDLGQDPAAKFILSGEAQPSEESEALEGSIEPQIMSATASQSPRRPFDMEILEGQGDVKSPKRDGYTALKSSEAEPLVKDPDPLLAKAETFFKAVTSRKPPVQDLPEDKMAADPRLRKTETVETPAHRNPMRSGVIKDYLATKVLTLAANNSQDKQVSFFALPLPFFNTVFLKVEKDTVAEDENSPLMLSFIIDTHNLGAVKLVLRYFDELTQAQITFDRSSSLDLARDALAQLGQDASPVLRALKLQTGEVSVKDFLLGSIREDNLKGVDVKI